MCANQAVLTSQVGQLCDILTLSPLLPNVSGMLGQIVQRVVAMDEPLEYSQRTPYNASLVLGMCLKSFSSQAKSTKPGIPSLDLADVCQRWGWSESTVGALASLATSRCVDALKIFLHDIDTIRVLDSSAERRWKESTQV